MNHVGIFGYQMIIPGTKTITKFTDKTAIQIVGLDGFLTEEYQEEFPSPPKIVTFCLRQEFLEILAPNSSD